MATLSTTRYTQPGAYIGQIIRPRVVAVTGTPRIPAYVGRGSRLAQIRGALIRRSFIADEQLTVAVTAPHLATLLYTANGDQEVAQLVDSEGRPVSKSRWAFDITGATITIDTAVFDASETYFLDYQATSRAVQDPMPFDDVRQLLTVGKSEDRDDFLEYADFYLPSTYTAPTADVGNDFTAAQIGLGLDTDDALATAVTGTVGANDALLWTAVTAGVAGQGINIVFAAGGATAAAEVIGTKTVNITYVTATDDAAAIISAVAGASLTLVTVKDYLTSTGVGVLTSPGHDDDVTTTSLGLASELLMSGGSNLTDHKVYLAQSSSYSHAYTRDYVVEVATPGSIDTAVLFWYSAAISGGNASLPRNPVNTALDEDATHGNVIDLSAPAAGTKTLTLEHGIVLTIEVGPNAVAFADGESFSFRVHGEGLLEVDSRLATNVNQFVTYTSNAAVGNTGAADIGFAATNDFSGTYNTRFKCVCTIASTGSGTGAATFYFAQYGETFASGTFTLSAADLTEPLGLGVVIEADFTGGDFAIGDEFTIVVLAPQVFYTAKDDRNYTINVTAAAINDVSLFYSVDTIEGSFGTVANILSTLPQALPDGVLLAVRNIDKPRYGVGDIFTLSLTMDDVIDWSLHTQVTETVSSANVIHDILGTITGTPDTYYLVLSRAPASASDITSVQNSVPTDLTYTWVTNTRYIWFATDPADTVTVVYTHIGNEPAPGDLYSINAMYLRPAELINEPILAGSRDESRNLLAPNSSENHLYNMSEIAWDNNPFGVYIIQVPDADGDGISTDVDFQDAIESSESVQGITDLIVLSRISVLSDALASIDDMNDPFERKERMLWVGMPAGTVVGNDQTVGSLVYTSKKTLAVYGNSPAHGTRVLVAPTTATRTIVLPDNSTQLVTFDGSFVAGALAALVSSFDDPGETVLRKTLNGFETLQVYGEQDNITLGSAQVIYLADEGSGVFRLLEDTTTDTFAPDFQIISAMTQKQFVTRFIRDQVDQNLIGIVPNSTEAAESDIRSFVAGSLGGLVARGIIASYQDENGNTRNLSPSTDVVVFRDDDDPTLYNINFAYFLRYPIKRIFGLFVVDSNDFGAA